MTRGWKKAQSLCWVRSAPSLSRDTGAAFPYSLPGMRSRTAAFFSIIYLRRKKRVSFSYDKGLLWLNVFTHSPVAAGAAGAVRGAVPATGGGLFFLAVRAALPPLFVFVGPAPVRPVCALCGTVCLSVCLVSGLAVCLSVGYN